MPCRFAAAYSIHVPSELFEHALPHAILQDSISDDAAVSLAPSEQAELRRRNRQQVVHGFSSRQGEAPADGTSTVRHSFLATYGDNIVVNCRKNPTEPGRAWRRTR